MTKRFWPCAIITLLSAGVSAGYSVNGLLSSGGDSFARYAASRSAALLLTVLIAVCVRSRMAIAFLDGVIGALAHDPTKTYGPFAFVSFNALALVWLLRGTRMSASQSFAAPVAPVKEAFDHLSS
jgi:hypothetical protein